MNDTFFSLNGQIVSAERALVSVTDRGFLYGDGVFETLHAYGPKLFRMKEHLERLSQGARNLFFDPVPDPRMFAQWLRKAAKAASFPEANVRITLTRGSGPRGPSILGPFKSTTVIMVTRYSRPPERRITHGVSAIVA